MQECKTNIVIEWTLYTYNFNMVSIGSNISIVTLLSQKYLPPIFFRANALLNVVSKAAAFMVDELTLRLRLYGQILSWNTTLDIYEF